MANQTNEIKTLFTGDISKLNQQIGNLNVNIQNSKDKIKELDKAIKEMGKDSGGRKDLIVLKAEEERKVRDLNKQLKETEKTLKEVGNAGKLSWASITAGIGVAVAAITKFIKLANKEEDSIRKVNFLFKEQGKNVVALASKLQKLTGVDNQVIQDMAVMAKTMGASNENIEKIIKGAIGLEKALGIDAKSAMRMLTTAIEEGDYTLLNRYIPSIRVATTETEKAAILNTTLEQSYKLAEDRMNSTAGAFETLGNTIRDESEKIGMEINKSLGIGSDSALNKAIQGVSTFFQWMIKGLRVVGTNIGIFVYNAQELIIGLGRTMTEVAIGALSTWNKTFGGLGKGIAEYIDTGDFTAIGRNIGEGLFKGIDQATGKIKGSFKQMEFASLDFSGLVIENSQKVSAELNDSTEKTIEKNYEFAESIERGQRANAEAYRKGAEVAKKFREELKKIQESNEEIDFGWVGESVDEYEDAQQKFKNMTDWSIQQAQTVAAIFTQLNQKEMQEIDDKYNAEKEKYNEMLEQNLITKEQYDTEIKKLDLKAAKDKKKALEKQQKVDIAIATMTTAQAVLSAFTGKDNVFTWQMWTQAALAAALGATQIATIASQKFAEGGLLQGPSHSQGGIKAGNVEFEGNEIVLKKAVTYDPLTRDVANYVNTLKRGRSVPGSKEISGMQIYYSDGRSATLSGKGRAGSGNGNYFAEGGMVAGINALGTAVVERNTTTIIQPSVSATLGFEKGQLALMVQSELNQMTRSGKNLEFE